MTFSFTDEQLITLSKRGLIAGPHESLDDFCQRVENSPPLSQEIDFSKLQSLYDIKPDWVKLVYSNKQLAPWEGGCSFEEEAKITIQLRSSLQKKDKLLGFYNKQELIEHELVHAARGKYGHSRFEELFAYQTSKSVFRKKVGAIIGKPKESLIYMLSLLGVILSMPWPLLFLFILGINLLILSWGIIRLSLFLKRFARAKKNIAEVVSTTNEILPLLLCLTDEEISFCASCAPEKIRDYFLENRDKSVRLRQIFVRFFYQLL